MIDHTRKGVFPHHGLGSSIQAGKQHRHKNVAIRLKVDFICKRIKDECEVIEH